MLYGKELADSETLNSLKALSLNGTDCLLVIWNNGPAQLKAREVDTFEQLGFDVAICETTENQSLSKIYNRFIDEFHSDKYVVLDDDSQLNQAYLQAVFQLTENEIGVPQIFSNHKLTGPKRNRKLCAVGDTVTDADKFFGIGSGLVIGKTSATRMKDDHGTVFDERFYFYGVDSTFFFRVKMSQISDRLRIISGFEHSLSKLKKESEPVTEFRLKEMSYDIGLRLRYYKPLVTGFFLVVKESLSCGLKKLRNKKPKVLTGHLLKAYFGGKHYRAK
ncbi:hypothetical protein [Shewanella sp. GXUN23E]|uniref:hypothetical protein n=1 Tax=Shewanella sp. GXUN23E TaxID=3422498 RepID=UPI003D7CEB16